MATRIKSYIDPKQVRKSDKESKKKIHEGKKTEQHTQKNVNQDDKRHPLGTHPNREVYETFTPLN